MCDYFRPGAIGHCMIKHVVASIIVIRATAPPFRSDYSKQVKMRGLVIAVASSYEVLVYY